MLNPWARIRELSDEINELKTECAKTQMALNSLQKINSELVKVGESMRQNARLIEIKTEGNKNVFAFIRKGELFTIETYSTTRDNLPEWKKQAGLE